jgi:predicted permease
MSARPSHDPGQTELARPPRLASRLVERALDGDPAAGAILGDLHEDFVRIARARGLEAARRYYLREAVPLALGRLARRAFTRAERSERSGSLHALAQDVTFALRAVRRTPGFSVFTAAIIALGVGAATAVFSVLRPLVLAPLPFQDADELVWISNVSEPGDNSLTTITSRGINLRDFRERSRSFDGMTGYNAFYETFAHTLRGVGEPERIIGVGVAHDFLHVLGIEPFHGRSFTVEEGRWRGPPAVILTHGFWRRRFGSDPGIVGRSIDLSGAPHTVVGVLSPSFDFASVFAPGKRVDYLVPYSIEEKDGYKGNRMFFIGRLRPGVSAEAAQHELDAIIAALKKEDPRRWGLGAEVTALREQVAGPFRPALLLLAAAAGTLLLIVCVNVSNLILARSPRRARELAVRKALGATRGRLARQLVLETLTISLAGAVLGSLIAWGATQMVATSAGIEIPLLNEVGVDGSALFFAVGVAVLTGVLVGILPALRVTEGGESAVLRSGGRGSGSGRGARRLSEALVVAEVTFACALLVAGGLLVRSFRAVMDVDLGFEPRNAVAWEITPGDVEPGRQETAFYAALTDRVAAVPGVEQVGLIDALPLGRARTWAFRVVGVPKEMDTDDELFPHVVDPGYLTAMRIPLVAGRNFTDYDTEDVTRVALINRSGARRVFGNEDVLGRRITLWGPWEWEIVGVVDDVRHVSPEMPAGIQLYLPMAQMFDYTTMDMVVRSALPVEPLVAAVTSALQEVNASMPTREFWTIESTVERSVSARRFTLGILSAFGTTALLLAGLGIYGVLAQSVAERKAEIGIRMAVGASARDVVRSLLGRTLWLTGAGIAAGAALSLGSASLLRSLLYGVSATDPGTFAAIAVVLLLVAGAAAALPAARAARTRGTTVLMAEQ